MSTTTSTTRDSYDKIAARKQAERQSLIPEAWRLPAEKLAEYTSSPTANVLHVPRESGILNERELDITENHDAVSLLERLRKGPKDGGFSSEEVVVAFCKRAALAQQLTNCVTEILFDSGIARAKELDSRRAANPDEALPPLWGLPISLKDCFKVPGFDASAGMILFAEKPATEYSALPKLLYQLGAVFYCKTNVPQTMMTADSDNNVFGRTLNPNNKSLTAGGSSGGEGALVAMRGSVLGIGSDIAGSIRIPSYCCGTYGFKPSANIVPYAGQTNPAADGIPGILPVAGPLATSMRSCNYFMQVVMSNQPWKIDVDCLHIPWRGIAAPEKGSKLRIGIVEDDGILTATPPVRRTLRQAREKLARAGVEIVDIKLPGIKEDSATIWASFAMEGCKTVLEYIGAAEEPYVQSVQNIGLVAMKSMTMEELFAWNVTRSKIETKYRDLWLENDLDAILNPLTAHTAPPLDTWSSISQAIWNLVDYPSCIIPTGKVEAEDVVDQAAKYGADDEKIYQLYTGPEDYKGAPTALQLIGMKQEDENLTLLASFVDGILNEN
ncbi:hypothetical protein LTR84_007816 [Exophiala bonariae]|uniref:amidase n=1 Tax=Exophiala bonariae TaxID=1690606 RepID=A0AAV9NNU3_9EURO|nr:hypothetical protein LTR84_007816 [Exophiala bonariae]